MNQFQGIAIRAIDITPDDEEVIGPTMGLYTNTTGDVEVTMTGDLSHSQVLFQDVPQGVFMPISVKRVTEGTTAEVIALYDS